MNIITSKWEKTGLLENIDSQYKDKLSGLLEEASTLFYTPFIQEVYEVEKSIGSKQGLIATTILPSLSKIFNKNRSKANDVEKLIDDYFVFLEENYGTYIGLEEDELEKAIIEDFCENYK